MQVLFWLLVAILLYTYGGYTLVIVLLSLLRSKPVLRDDSFEPTVSFLITAYNEERDLPGKLDNTVALDYPQDKLEILVASDGSTDRTDQIVSEYAARFPHVRLLRVEGRVGKTETQNQAVASARGEIVIFSDATTDYREDAIRKLVRNYADPEVGAVSGKYAYRSEEGSSMGLSTIIFWTFENFIKSRQTRIRTITGCCGCIYSVRREAYVPLPRTIISDLVEPLKVLDRGYRIVFETEAIAFETTTERVREEFGMRVRVITRGMNGIRYVAHLLNPFRYPFVSFQLLSHKVLRWLVPVHLLLLVGASAWLAGSAWIYTAALAGQLAFYGLALIGLLAEWAGGRLRLAAIPLYFCVVNAASLVGMFNLLRGKRKATWETVRR